MSDCGPVDCSLPGSSLHGILQARILDWVAISFNKVNYNWEKICGGLWGLLGHVAEALMIGIYVLIKEIPDSFLALSDL